MQHSNLFIAIVLVALLVPVTATAGAEGAPDISIFTPENTLTPGEETPVTLEIANNGDAEKAVFESDHNVSPSTQQELEARTKTAQNTRITLSNPTDAPVDITTNTIPLGPIQDGEIRQATFRIDVEESADPGTYELDATIEYTYDNQLFADGQVANTETVEEDITIEVVVDERANFKIVDSTTHANIGDSDTTELTLENTGTETAHDATVGVQSENPQITFGENPTATRYIGDWNPGETRTIEVDTSIAQTAVEEHYALSTTVTYDDPNGTPIQSNALSTGITPNEEQSFTINGTHTDLRVGETKTITGTITNDGPDTIKNAVVVFTTESRNFHVEEHRYDIGTLAPDETTEFHYRVDINTNSDPGQRQLSFALEYDTQNDTPRIKDGLKLQSTVQPEQPPFTVNTTTTSLTPGETERVTVEVTNNADSTLSNIDAKAHSNSPLTMDSDTAFIQSLAPGETQTITFTTTTDSDATPTTQSISVDFQYDTSDGDTKLSDTFPVALTITEPPDRNTQSLALLAITALLVLIGSAAIWRYRN